MSSSLQPVHVLSFIKHQAFPYFLFGLASPATELCLRRLRPLSPIIVSGLLLLAYPPYVTP